MKLSDRDIIQRIETESIVITPTPPENAIKGASVDLRLGNEFRLFASDPRSHIDLWGTGEETRKTIDEALSTTRALGPDETFYLHPGKLALGLTEESVTVPDDLCAILNGRSSLARLGLMVHATSHFVDPGWSGRIVLEFFNCGPVPLGLQPGMTVCAIAFEQLSSPALRPYRQRTDAKYKDQDSVIGSRMGEERRQT